MSSSSGLDDQALIASLSDAVLLAFAIRSVSLDVYGHRWIFSILPEIQIRLLYVSNLSLE